ncbi:peptide chain release factor N(5)-glutamine methyltransferase [Actinospongicola halichondriae]|uniref:peptide chain release factor N(5)-glutamine methyltransferase n=1 Tax=Actinospongicola halichondriae TaxID=3236844 RepID=UPI003D3C546A
MEGSEVDSVEDTVSWSQLHAETVARLRASGVENADAEARWIVERAAGDPLRVAAEEPATVRSHHHWRVMVERREQGEPLQYVLERWEFRTLELFVDRRVLIPRPETEVVVDAVLQEHTRVGGPVVDLGTGSGAIALSIAVERPGTEVWGVERSADALAVARANCTGLGRRAGSVRLIEGSWLEPLPESLLGAVGVIASNPPYVTDDEPLPALVEEWEPRGALRAGADGLDDIRVIVAEAPRWLAPGGALVVEHAPQQAEAVRLLASDAGFDQVRTGGDLTGRDRYLVARI